MKTSDLTRREAVLAFVAVLAAPVAALALEEPCSWYGDSFSFSSGVVRLPSRYFDGNNIGLEMNCTATGTGRFSVTCYRANGASVGTKSFSYKGFTKATWPSVGPGNYYSCLSKNRDGVRVSSSNVALFSW